MARISGYDRVSGATLAQVLQGQSEVDPDRVAALIRARTV